MISTLTLPEVVTLIGLYCALFFALCKLTAYFDEQYDRAFARRKDLVDSYSSLIARLDAKLRGKLERGSGIGPVIVEGRFSELRDREYAFLPEKEYRQVITEILPLFADFARANELARWLPTGFLWLWRLAVLELAGMIVLAANVVYEALTNVATPHVYRWCFTVQGVVFAVGFVLYCLIKSRGQRLGALYRVEDI